MERRQAGRRNEVLPRKKRGGYASLRASDISSRNLPQEQQLILGCVYQHVFSDCNTAVWSLFQRFGEKDCYKKPKIGTTPLRCLLSFLFRTLGFFPCARGRFSSCACPRESSARASQYYPPYEDVPPLHALAACSPPCVYNSMSMYDIYMCICG